MIIAIRPLFSLLFDGLLWPVSDSPRLALVWCAVVLGLLVGWLMRWLTPRTMLARLAAQSKAELLAIRLFADQPGSVVRSLLRLLGLSLNRISCFIPGALLLLPAGLLIESQLEMRFARRALLPEETAMVRMEFTPNAWPEAGEVHLVSEAPLSGNNSQWSSGCKIVGPLHDPLEHAIYWEVKRVRSSEEFVRGGSINLAFTFRDERLIVPLLVADSETEMMAIVDRWKFEGVDQINIQYPPRKFQFAGMQPPWWGIFLLVFCAIAWIVINRQAMPVQ